VGSLRACQIHAFLFHATADALTSRSDLSPGEVCWRISAWWREENYFPYPRTRFALDALDSYAAAPDDSGPDGAQPGQEGRSRAGLAGRSRRATAEGAWDAGGESVRQRAFPQFGPQRTRCCGLTRSRDTGPST
jgi:hypothetical protein